MTTPRFAETFHGPQSHRTAFVPRHEFTGRRVAIIGTGAAAARLLPGIAAEAARVTVFQSDAVWILPRAPLPDAETLRRTPDWVVRLIARVNLRVQVRDSWLRHRLTPDDTAGVAVHNSYYRTLRQPHCTLVTWPIARLVPQGVRTVDGIEHRVDTIVYAEDAGHVVRMVARAGRMHNPPELVTAVIATRPKEIA
ncbi:NAD(P)/FAD-dependent oxidoreductase [Nocardia cyriacigeorgica]|uniref:NAD(P)/FAD-dependent oxidoreductase n=1 Tax=Nocardia cyriacigeorgica TaxID=135487 RepID=A0A6P1DC96_9NOCA|nr:NAD(P)/FAD-dependent oxidoreductase [Nocardia cyriacigeorgica]NEW39866.1 NAD(P)/FAD-dependent oxidoreductase [Nocardia cyriacigeorgica]NEW47189.1 NAD(P)/FAD-dependent oxidoreductase [Nocardia cyriacigeorgica]NEW55430.1 NAD(P)/FAD-dependent oxidoreductase [Nocardia cyriacigeorgica]